MAKLCDLTCPIVARSARFNANQTRSQVFKKSQNLCSAQRLTHNNFTLAVRSVHLKNTLGQIKADRSNFHHGWLPSLVVV